MRIVVPDVDICLALSKQNNVSAKFENSQERQLSNKGMQVNQKSGN